MSNLAFRPTRAEATVTTLVSLSVECPMIMTRTVLFALVLAASPVPTLAQHQHALAVSPYAGFEKRAVKSLSDQQIADLKAERGMGYALAAELNGYPGPAMCSSGMSNSAYRRPSGPACSTSSMR